MGETLSACELKTVLVALGPAMPRVLVCTHVVRQALISGELGGETGWIASGCTISKAAAPRLIVVGEASSLGSLSSTL